MGASGVSALPTFCPFSSSHIQDVMGNFPKKKGGVFLTEHELNAKNKTKKKGSTPDNTFGKGNFELLGTRHAGGGEGVEASRHSNTMLLDNRRASTFTRQHFDGQKLRQGESAWDRMGAG